MGRLQADWIPIASEGDQPFDALYVAGPRGAPAIVLLQEIFGVNAFMRCAASRVAGAGYAVCVPDLFWRESPRLDLDPNTEADRSRAMALNHAFDDAASVRDLQAVFDAMRARHVAVGVVGFCIGGRLAYTLAGSTGTSCSVAFYGIGLDRKIRAGCLPVQPVLLHVAGDDHLCPPETQLLIREALSGNSWATVHTYAGTGHGFAREGGAHFNAPAATLAWQRTFEFLARHLGPGSPR